MYVISQIQITEARHSIDGMRHKHKLYLYPIPDKLRDLGITSCWSRGKRGAIRFDSKRQAQIKARKLGGQVEEA